MYAQNNNLRQALEAIEARNLARLEALINETDALRYEFSVKEAAAKTGLSYVTTLHTEDTDWSESRFLDMAARSGKCETVRFMLDHGSHSQNAARHAAECNHQAVLEILMEAELVDESAIVEAAGRGNVELVNWLFEQGIETTNSDAINAAASHDYLDLVQLLADRGQQCNQAGLYSMFNNGHSRVLDYLLEHDNVIEGGWAANVRQAADTAAATGSYEMQQTILQRFGLTTNTTGASI